MGLPLSVLAILSLVVLLTWVTASRAWLKSFQEEPNPAWVDWLLIAVLPLIGAAAYWPFAHNGLLGAGDSYHYSLQVADAVTQARQGQWPIMAGQSVYAFNGNVHTVRTAPYFTHLAAALDLVTGRKLNFWQLTNLIILGSGALSAWLVYVCARWLAPSARVLAALLATLYVLSPALGTPLMIHDMFATFVATPWLPLVCASAVQCWRTRATTPWVLLAFSLGLTWLAHPPTAIWITPLGAAAALLAVVLRPLRPTVLRAMASAVLFTAIAGYVVYGVSSLYILGDLHESPDPAPSILSNLQTSWPDSWKPLELNGHSSGNIQLGYALWAVAVMALVTTFINRRNSAAWFYLGSFALLLCFVAPVPVLTVWIWEHLPLQLKVITNAWPMQRLYPVLSAVSVLFGAASLGALREKKRTAYSLILAVLGFGLVWSSLEHRKLEQRGAMIRRTTLETSAAYEPSTLSLTRSSYALFSIFPVYYSHGWMDPEFESRLLERDGKTSITNSDFVEKNTLASDRIPVPLGLPFTLEITKETDYLLVFTFSSPQVTGEVTVQGPKISRHYTLPLSGESASFGSTETNQHSVRLACPEPGQQSFVVNGPPGTTVTALRFTRTALPIQLQSVSPFVAKVSARSEGYLETPRCYIPGYQARVEGQAVQPVHSGHRLVSVPVPAGTSRIELNYVGPPGLRAAGWLATGAVLLGAITLVCGPRRWFTSADEQAPRGSAAETSISPEHSIAANRKRLLLGGALLTGLVTGAYLIYDDRSPPLAEGNLRIAVQFPSVVATVKEPVVVTGKTGAADVLFAVYNGETFQLGIDHWGVGGPLSPPLPLNASHEYLIEYESAALQLGVGKATHSRVRVLVDGRAVLDENLPNHPAAKRELYLGKNPVGSSACTGAFSGWLERLP